MLELINVCYSAENDGIKKDIIKDVSLKLDEKFIAFTGPNGGGKSTLAKLIMGIIKPTSGKILFDGKDITKLPPHKRELNTVFQKYALFPHMNIEENKKLWAKIVAKAWCDDAYKAALLNNAEQVLKAEGAEIPEGVHVHVVEEQKPSTAEDIYLYLPPINQTICVHEEEMKRAAGACDVCQGACESHGRGGGGGLS